MKFLADENFDNKDDDLKIDKEQCLKTLQKIKQSGLSGFSEIVDVKQYIQDVTYLTLIL